MFRNKMSGVHKAELHMEVNICIKPSKVQSILCVLKFSKSNYFYHYAPKFQYLIVMMKLFSASVANDENDQWNLSPFKYSIFICDSISKFHSVPLSLPPSIIICIKCFLCQSYHILLDLF